MLNRDLKYLLCTPRVLLPVLCFDAELFSLYEKSIDLRPRKILGWIEIISICASPLNFLSCILIFIYWLCWVLVAAQGTFHLHCRMQDLQLWRSNSWLWHVGSNPLTRDQTGAPSIGSIESCHWTTTVALSLRFLADGVFSRWGWGLAPRPWGCWGALSAVPLMSLDMERGIKLIRPLHLCSLVFKPLELILLPPPELGWRSSPEELCKAAWRGFKLSGCDTHNFTPKPGRMMPRNPQWPGVGRRAQSATPSRVEMVSFPETLSFPPLPSCPGV